MTRESPRERRSSHPKDAENGGISPEPESAGTVSYPQRPSPSAGNSWEQDSGYQSHQIEHRWSQVLSVARRGDGESVGAHFKLRKGRDPQPPCLLPHLLRAAGGENEDASVMSSRGNDDAAPTTPRRRTVHTPHGSLSYFKSTSEKAEYLKLASQSQISLPVEDKLPHGVKLMVLILALGLSVFLVALVGLRRYKEINLLISTRTTPL